MECTQIRKQSDLIRRMARQYIHILRVHCLPVPLVDRRFQNLAVTKLVQHEHARSGALRRLVGEGLGGTHAGDGGLNLPVNARQFGLHLSGGPQTLP